VPLRFYVSFFLFSQAEDEDGGGGRGYEPFDMSTFSAFGRGVTG